MKCSNRTNYIDFAVFNQNKIPIVLDYIGKAAYPYARSYWIQFNNGNMRTNKGNDIGT